MRTRDAVGGWLPEGRAARRGFWLLLLVCGIAANGLGCATFALAGSANPSGRIWFATSVSSDGSFPYTVRWRVRQQREFPGDPWFAPHGELTLDAPLPGCDRLRLVSYWRTDEWRELAAERVEFGHFNGQSGKNLVERLLRDAALELDACDVLLVGDKAPDHDVFMVALDREGREIARSQVPPRRAPSLWAWPLVPVALAFDVATLPLQLLLLFLFAGGVRG